MNKNLIAIYGSPRKNGNTAILLNSAVKGVIRQGYTVKKIFLYDYKIKPCIEDYSCIKNENCCIKDDFQKILDLILRSDGLLVASPIFFYSVSAQLKLFIDRCQVMWVKKNKSEKVGFELRNTNLFSKNIKKGMFIAAGATGGEKLFDGAILTMKYFFNVLNIELSETLPFRHLDYEGEVKKHPDYIKQVYNSVRKLF